LPAGEEAGCKSGWHLFIEERIGMETRKLLPLTPVAILLVGGLASNLHADDLGFRYVRPTGSRTLVWQPRDSVAFVGNQVYFFPTSVSSQPPTPNQWLSFQHPFTHAYVSVPVRLPPGMPRLEQRSDRVIYDYGIISIVIQFVRDGSVNVSYNSKTP
jgi:hypothetical protein